MEPSISFRIQAVDGKGLLGQRRHDQRIGKQPEYVNAERTHLNEALYRAEGWDRVPGSTVKEDTVRAHKLMEASRKEMEARAKRKTKVGKYWRTAIITFSHDAQKVLAEMEITPHAQALAAFTEFAEAHGAKLLTVDFHGDETAPHYHATFEGINEKGYAVRFDRETLGQEQDHIARHFGDLGLTRGKKRVDRIADGEDPSKWNHRNVRELHQQHMADNEAELAELQKKIEAAEERRATNEQRAEKARAKAEADESRAAKALKNAESYEKRARDAELEIERLEGRIASLKGELETVKQAVAQKKTKIASLENSNSSLRQRKASLQARLKTLNAA